MMTSKSNRKHPAARAASESCDQVAETQVSATPDREAEIAAVRAEADSWKERAARAQAEFENTRKRLEAQQAEVCSRATDRVVEGLLPAVDDLDRAIAHGQETGNEMVAGLVAIREKLLTAFEREGVELIDPQVGEPFDHETQSAMQMVENADLPDQSVAQVFQKGYCRQKRVIRPAMVIVARS
jgi:molecular chaperone GrpE